LNFIYLFKLSIYFFWELENVSCSMIVFFNCCIWRFDQKKNCRMKLIRKNILARKWATHLTPQININSWLTFKDKYYKKNQFVEITMVNFPSSQFIHFRVKITILRMLYTEVIQLHTKSFITSVGHFLKDSLWVSLQDTTCLLY
jgi:hypothetical protein